MASRLRRRHTAPSAVVDGEDHLSDLDLVAFFDADILYCAADRGRDFDNRFVGFQLHYRLPFAHGGARGDHEAHEIALFNVFSEFGEFEFDH